jgi:protein arginine N-methyltransferase 5
MAFWDCAAVATLITLDDIGDAPIGGDRSTQTPVLNLVADARSTGYEFICLPLTTKEWKTRWTETCLLPTEYDNDRDIAAEQRAEEWRSKPAFVRTEVTMTRLGGYFSVLDAIYF